MLRKAPYFLIRTATPSLNNFSVSLTDLIGFNEKKKELSERLENENTALILYISDLVSKESSDEYRKLLINLKRKIKCSVKSIPKTDKYVSNAKLYISLERRNAFIESIKAIERNIESSIKNNINASRHSLKDELMRNTLFYNALVMDSSFDMLMAIKKYTSIDDSANKKSRHIEKTVKNYLNRMVKKPSPLSTFTTVSIEISTLQERSFDAYSFAKSSARLNEIIFKLLEEQILNNLSFRKSWLLFINPTLTKDIHTEFAYFVKSDMSNPQALYSKECILKIRQNDLLTYLDDIFNGSRFLSYEFVLTQLNNFNKDSREKNEKLLLYLIQKGVICVSLGFDDQDLNKIDKFITFFNKISNSNLKDCSRLLSQLKEITSNFNNNLGKPDKKIQLKLSAIDKLKVIFEKFGLSLKEENINFKNIYYENNVNQQILSSHFNDKQNKINSADIDKIIMLFQLFDDSITGKLVLKKFFVNTHHLTDKIPLIIFFNEWEKNGLQEGAKVFESINELKIIKSLRKEFFHYLDNHIDKKESFADKLFIDNNWFERFIQKIHEVFQPLESFGIYYQVDNKGNVVVNNVSPGYGRHFFRYAIDLPKSSLTKLERAYNETLNNTANKGKIADIGSTVGLNINLHPEVLNNIISYPGSSFPVNRNKNVLKLSDLFVQINTQSELLEIVDATGCHIEPAPMGFLFSRIAPKLYEFIMGFSSNNGIKVNFWDRFYKWKYDKTYKNVCHFPSILVYDNYIIGRETWYLKKAVSRYNNSKNSIDSINFDYMDIFKLLQEIHYLHSGFFTKVSLEIDALLNKDESSFDWVKQISIGKLRKPQYYDVNNYLDLKNFISAVDSKSIISIQPSLPDSDHSEEYLAEFYREKIKRDEL